VRPRTSTAGSFVNEISSLKVIPSATDLGRSRDDGGGDERHPGQAERDEAKDQTALCLRERRGAGPTRQHSSSNHYCEYRKDCRNAGRRY
jgi:hypothetical protein